MLLQDSPPRADVYHWSHFFIIRHRLLSSLICIGRGVLRYRQGKLVITDDHELVYLPTDKIEFYVEVSFLRTTKSICIEFIETVVFR